MRLDDLGLLRAHEPIVAWQNWRITVAVPLAVNLRDLIRR
jgi:hypothetical protein